MREVTVAKYKYTLVNRPPKIGEWFLFKGEIPCRLKKGTATSEKETIVWTNNPTIELVDELGDAEWIQDLSKRGYSDGFFSDLD